MTLALQSSLVGYSALILYAALGIWVFFGGRPVRMGFGMIVAAVLPVLFQKYFTDSDAPGFVLMMMFLIPIPLLLIVVGTAIVVVRLIRRRLAAC